LSPDLPDGFLEETVWAFTGSDPLVMDQAARQAAAQSGCPLLRIDLEEAKKQEKQLHQVVKYASEDSLLTGAVPYFKGWNAAWRMERLRAVCWIKFYNFPTPSFWHHRSTGRRAR